MGGKSRLAKYIAARLPASRCYCEVFGGAGWVLFAREPSPVEIFNDRHERLIELYRVVRDDARRLARELTRLPRARPLYYELLHGARDGDRVRRAAAFYYLVKNAFSGRVGYGFSASKRYAPKYSMRNDFDAWAERLNKVTLENLDYEECLARYDSAETVFYLDPPYFGKERYYGDAFAASDHERLRDALAGAHGRWLLSYNDCPQVRILYDGSRLEEVRPAYSAAKVAAGDRRRDVGHELLLSNF